MRISCIIPCYEEERMVFFAIKSALAFADEILVFDDASSDTSYAQMMRALNIAPDKIRLFSGRIRSNPKVRNELIDRAKHEIIVCLDADIVFIPERKDDYLEIISKLKPNTFYRFGNLEISRDLTKTTRKVFGPKDVGFSCFIKSPGMDFYADDDGFAKFHADNFDYISGIYTIHFKFNKAPERIAKRCVYRESVMTGKTIEELFELRYGGKKPVVEMVRADIGPTIPDEYAKLDVYREVVDYANRYYDILV